MEDGGQGEGNAVGGLPDLRSVLMIQVMYTAIFVASASLGFSQMLDVSRPSAVADFPMISGSRDRFFTNGGPKVSELMDNRWTTSCS